MIQESLSPLQAKYRLLQIAGGGGAGLGPFSIPANPYRHTLQIHSNGQWNVAIQGASSPFLRSSTADPIAQSLTYDVFGDLIRQNLTVTLNGANTEVFISETYYEEGNIQA